MSRTSQPYAEVPYWCEVPVDHWFHRKYIEQWLHERFSIHPCKQGTIYAQMFFGLVVMTGICTSYFWTRLSSFASRSTILATDAAEVFLLDLFVSLGQASINSLAYAVVLLIWLCIRLPELFVSRFNTHWSQWMAQSPAPTSTSIPTPQPEAVSTALVLLPVPESSPGSTVPSQRLLLPTPGPKVKLPLSWIPTPKPRPSSSSTTPESTQPGTSPQPSKDQKPDDAQWPTGKKVNDFRFNGPTYNAARPAQSDNKQLKLELSQALEFADRQGKEYLSFKQTVKENDDKFDQLNTKVDGFGAKIDILSQAVENLATSGIRSVRSAKKSSPVARPQYTDASTSTSPCEVIVPTDDHSEEELANERQKRQELEASVAALVQANEEGLAREKNASVKTLLDKLASDKALKQKTAQISQLDNQLAVKDAELVGVQNLLSRRTTELSDATLANITLQAGLAENNQSAHEEMQASEVAVRNELHESEHARLALEQELQVVKEKAEDYGRASDARVIECEARMQSIQASVQAGQGENTQTLNNLAQQVQQLQGALQVAEQKGAAVEAERDEYQIAGRRLESRLAAHTQQGAMVSEQVMAQAREENGRLQAEIEQLRASNESLRAQNQHKDDLIQDASEEAEPIRQQLEETKQDLEETKQELEETKQQLINSDLQVENIRRSWQRAESQIENIVKQGNAEALVQEQKELTQQCEELTEEVEDLKGEADFFQAEIDELKEDVEEARRNGEQAVQDVTAAKDEIIQHLRAQLKTPTKPAGQAFVFSSASTVKAPGSTSARETALEAQLESANKQLLDYARSAQVDEIERDQIKDKYDALNAKVKGLKAEKKAALELAQAQADRAKECSEQRDVAVTQLEKAADEHALDAENFEETANRDLTESIAREARIRDLEEQLARGFEQLKKKEEEQRVREKEHRVNVEALKQGEEELRRKLEGAASVIVAQKTVLDVFEAASPKKKRVVSDEVVSGKDTERMRNRRPEQAPPTTAAGLLKEAFPSGWERIDTSGEGLLCGLRAVVSSVAAQHPTIEPLTVEKLQLELNSTEYQAAVSEFGPISENNFRIDELANLVHTFYLVNEINMSLGVVMPGREPFIVSGDGEEKDEKLTTWVHNDRAQEIAQQQGLNPEGLFSHYEGLRHVRPPWVSGETNVNTALNDNQALTISHAPPTDDAMSGVRIMKKLRSPTKALQNGFPAPRVENKNNPFALLAPPADAEMDMVVDSEMHVTDTEMDMDEVL